MVLTVEYLACSLLCFMFYLPVCTGRLDFFIVAPCILLRRLSTWMLFIVSHAGERVWSSLKLAVTSQIPVIQQCLKTMLHSESQPKKQSH